MVLIRGGRTFFVLIKYRIPHQGDLNPVSGNTKIPWEPGFIFCASVPTNRGKSMQDVQHSQYDGSPLLFVVVLFSLFFLQGKVQSTKLMQKSGILLSASGLRRR